MNITPQRREKVHPNIGTFTALLTLNTSIRIKTQKNVNNAMMRILTLGTCADVSDRLISRLRKAGYHTYEAIDNATAYDISTYAEITLQQAQNIKNKLKLQHPDNHHPVFSLPHRDPVSSETEVENLIGV